MSEKSVSSSGSEPARGGVRASDADRERLISELNEHTVAGRLSTDEFEQRVQQVYAARTTADLNSLRHDLPPTEAAVARSHAQRRTQLTRRLIQESGGSLSLFVLCTVVWVVSGAHGQFWPVWVLLIVLGTLIRNGWALFGPAPDLEAVEQHLDRQRERRLAHDQRRHRRRLDR